ncbi:MAG: tRNA-2-methylthio-N(6)-dimethylallyladenosine synthase [candidate division WS2 bacterium]|nr:tRNA-2-methylthio-N(6)-dimethylallyladenosine synthase [Candidatus Lithacetigena glycinireducens]
MSKKYYLYTYGCQMNFYDSSKVESLLEQKGIIKAEAPEEADVILVNTCSVRDHAEERAWGSVGNIKQLKQKNPNLKIGVIGCMAERLGTDILKRASYVDFIIGPNQIKNIISVLDREEKGSVVLTGDSSQPYPQIPIKKTRTVIAYIAAMKGCNCHCAYCIVPYTRGKEESRSITDIFEEVQQVLEEGPKEIHLLGQNITNYGKDLGMKNGFIRLLEAVHNVDKVIRLKYITPHPKDFTFDIIYALKQLPKIPEHFHLPVQSGDDEVLRTMNRGYTTSEYLMLIDEIRKYFPDSGISTDVIIGFPSETKHRFSNTVDFFKKIKFDNAYITTYSPRPGTPSSKIYNDVVSPEEKKERHQILSAVQEEISLNLNQKYLGKTLEVLVEEYSPKYGAFSGRSRTNKIVSFKSSNPKIIGKLVNIKIKEAGSWVLKGDEA